MEETTKILLMLGALFFVGLLADLLGRKTPLPRVTLLLVIGFLIGPAVLDLLPDFSEAWFPILTEMALIMIGFLLGEEMTLALLRKRGRIVLSISIAEVLATAGFILIGLLMVGFSWEVAVLLAGVAPATDPAATVDVARELDAKGEFTDTLLGIVAIDDAWGLLMFSILLAVAEAVAGGAGAGQVLASGAWEVGGALILGVGLGIPLAYLTGRIRPGEPTQAEALGMVLLCGGLATWMHVSYILAAMVLGSMVANFASHHSRPFHAIEGIEWPFMILFFVLAGASLQVDSLIAAGLLGLSYITLRVIGRYAGGVIGGRISRAEISIQKWMGPALLPQAGVALGMALMATQRFPDLKDIIIPVVIGSTVIFEVIGPVVTRSILVKLGDAPKEEKE
jgi:Kef-type K+ transport system membrane component KefB